MRNIIFDLNEIFGNAFFGRESREIEDVDYEDLTPPRLKEETYEDLTGENPEKP